MKRLLLSFCLAAFALLGAYAAEVVVDNIKYTLQRDNTLKCAAANKNALVDVIIPEIVRLNGIDYYVGKVENDGFRKCKNLKSIELPNTVKIIGLNAFNDCRNLETVVMPDEAEALIFPAHTVMDDKAYSRGA